MAMNKAEKAELEEARRQAAFRRTMPVQRDVLPPPTTPDYAEGWDFNTHSKTVWLGWTTCISHGTGPAPVGKRHYSGSQGARSMFSTKELALRALRYALEEAAASDLRKIDAQIEEVRNA